MDKYQRYMVLGGMAKSYRRVVWRRAWERTMSEALGQSTEGRLIRYTAALLTLGTAYGWVRLVNEHSDVFSDALRAFALSFGTMGAIVVALFFINLFWSVPKALWAEQSGKVEELEGIIRPRFSVLVHNLGRPQRFDFGNIQRSPFTGATKALVRHSINALAIDATNETATTLEGCEAYLSSINEVGGEHGVFHSMRLEWVPVGDEVSTVTIPSGGQRTFIVFQVTAERVAFSHDRMPLRAATMLKENAYYYGVITLTAKNAGTSYVGFLLNCVKGDPPHFTLARRGFQDEEIIPWAPETCIGL